MGHPPCTSKTEEAEVMVQGNGHQQSPRYRASPLPKIDEDDVDSGRIFTKELRRKRITPHSTSVDGMPRGGTESGHARSGELLGRGGTHARHTTGQHDMF